MYLYTETDLFVGIAHTLFVSSIDFTSFQKIYRSILWFLKKENGIMICIWTFCLCVEVAM